MCQAEAITRGAAHRRRPKRQRRQGNQLLASRRGQAPSALQERRTIVFSSLVHCCRAVVNNRLRPPTVEFFIDGPSMLRTDGASRSPDCYTEQRSLLLGTAAGRGGAAGKGQSLLVGGGGKNQRNTSDQQASATYQVDQLQSGKPRRQRAGPAMRARSPSQRGNRTWEAAAAAAAYIRRYVVAPF